MNTTALYYTLSKLFLCYWSDDDLFRLKRVVLLEQKFGCV